MKKLLYLLCFVTLLGCGSDDAVQNILTTMTIQSSNGTRLDIGATTSLSVSALDQTSQSFAITTTIVWSADNANVTVDQSGNVTAVAVGNSTITAATEGVQAEFDIRVWDSSAPRTDIYVSDAGNGPGSPPYQILRFDENGENPEVFTTEGLSWPQDILFLEDQNVVLISNLNSNSIGRYNIDNGSLINTFATGISGPTRMKIGPDNLLYVLQWSGNGLVLRYQLDGTFVDQFTSFAVNESIGMDWDSDGNLYVSSFNSGGGGFVRKFDTSGADQGLFINSNLQGPTNIWFGDGGDLFVNDWTGGRVVRFNASGAFLGNTATGLSRLEGIAVLDNGNFLIGDGGSGTGTIKEFTRGGVFVRDLVSRGSGSLKSPNAVTLRKVN